MTHSFEDFCSWLLGFLACRPLMRQHIVVKATLEGEVHFFKLESKEKKHEEELGMPRMS